MLRLHRGGATAVVPDCWQALRGRDRAACGARLRAGDAVARPAAGVVTPVPQLPLRSASRGRYSGRSSPPPIACKICWFSGAVRQVRGEPFDEALCATAPILAPCYPCKLVCRNLCRVVRLLDREPKPGLANMISSTEPITSSYFAQGPLDLEYDSHFLGMTDGDGIRFSRMQHRRFGNRPIQAELVPSANAFAEMAGPNSSLRERWQLGNS